MARVELLWLFRLYFASKLRALKVILKSWNREVFGRVEVKKSEALRKVGYFDQKEKKNLMTLKEAADRFLLMRITNIGPYWRKRHRGRNPKNFGLRRETEI